MSGALHALTLQRVPRVKPGDYPGHSINVYRTKCTAVGNIYYEISGTCEGTGFVEVRTENIHIVLGMGRVSKKMETEHRRIQTGMPQSDNRNAGMGIHVAVAW